MAVNAVFPAHPRRELAVLEWDSLVDGDASREDHSVRFRHPRLTVELRLSANDDSTGISGHVQPVGPNRAVLYAYASDVGLIQTIVDGAFWFGPQPHGTVRLALEGPSTDVIWTDWLRI